MKAKLPYEKETLIRWDEEKDGPAELYTASKAVADRLKKSGLKPIKQEDGAWWFEFPKEAMRVKTGNKACYVAGQPKKKTG